MDTQNEGRTRMISGLSGNLEFTNWVGHLEVQMLMKDDLVANVINSLSH